MEVKIYQANNSAFAGIIKEYLQSNGIFAYIRPEGPAPYFGEAAPASIFVRQEDEAVARELIRDFTL